MNQLKKRAELLAPAAGFLSVQAVFRAGADAVYIGGEKFGARAYADNMKEEELLRAIDYAHLHNKKLYLTVNTVLKDEEIEEQLYNYLLTFYRQGLDAVIVQDIGVLDFVMQKFPELPIHASTQMAVTGEYAPEYFEKIGIERVVTARELSLEEIKNIKSKAPDIEIESFVHGALCMGYSGMCFYSSSLGDRSGNRGRCAQSCRLKVNLLNENGERNKVLRDKNYCLSPKDLCTLSILPQIIEAGVYSLKIEGRMKRTEYMCKVTEIYHKYLDIYLNNGVEGYTVSKEDMEILMDLYNRGGFTTGYYTKRNGADMMSSDRPNHYGVYLGRARRIKEALVCSPGTDLHAGDVLELRLKNNKGEDKAGSRDNEFTVKEDIRKGSNFTLPVNKKINNFYDGAPVFRIKNQKLLSELQKEYLDADIYNGEKIIIDGELTVSMGEPIVLKLFYKEIEVRAEGEIVQQAKNCKTDKAQLSKSINKTGNTPFAFEKININIIGDCFVSVASVNNLRRNAIGTLENKILSVFRRNEFLSDNNIDINMDNINNTNNINNIDNINNSRLDAGDENRLARLTVQASTVEQALELCNINEVGLCYLELNAFALWNKGRDKEIYCRVLEEYNKKGKDLYISLPAILRMDRSALIKENAGWLFNGVKGVLVHNLEQLLFIKKLICEKIIKDIGIAADYSLYHLNSYSVRFLEKIGVLRGTFSVELTKREMVKLSEKTDFPMELIFYGYMPMMFTAQCQKKNSQSCDSKASNMYLLDRMGKKLLVRTNCDYCYNTIYNSQAFSLFGLEEEVKKMSPQGIRLIFTTESPKEMKRIVYNFIDRFYGEKDSKIAVSSFTRGHFRKGVE